jgi:MoaA/NifB/PqqE/SkfB family radical SAM enzyme
MNDLEKEKLRRSKTFCVLPWMHLHAFPQGQAYPCCMYNIRDGVVGNLRTETLAEVFNGEKMKELRRNMLGGVESPSCFHCYEREQTGGGSTRQASNQDFQHHIDLVDKTLPDGTMTEFKMRYWDIRFSNLCNMSCRMCGPLLSSNWHKEYVKMWDKTPTDVAGRELAVVEYAGRFKGDVWEQLQEHIPYVEKIYFAGGEPLIMEEHYQILDKLIELGRTDVFITYNTNFSKLNFKQKHCFDYWKHFKISVGASLDASGARGELIRKGTVWNETVENRRRMIEELPNADFYVASTVGAMNILHVMDFHREWVELGLVSANGFNLNPIQTPHWYRIDILPEKFKQEVVAPKIIEHLKWLEPIDTFGRATACYKAILAMMLATDNSASLPRFRKEVALLDHHRGEDFWATFPELSSIRDDQ